MPAHNTNNTYVPAMTFLPKQNHSFCITSTHQFESSAGVTKRHTHFLIWLSLLSHYIFQPKLPLPLLKDQILEKFPEANNCTGYIATKDYGKIVEW